jgi:hypothetical protein
MYLISIHANAKLDRCKRTYMAITLGLPLAAYMAITLRLPLAASCLACIVSCLYSLHRVVPLLLGSTTPVPRRRLLPASCRASTPHEFCNDLF